jgi:hypothetical protein
MSTNLYTPREFSPPYSQPDDAPPAPAPISRLIVPAAVASIGAVLLIGGLLVAIAFYNKADWTLSEVDRERFELIETIQEEWTLPAREEAEVIAQVNRIFDAHENGQISYEQCEGIFTELLKTPHFGILSARDFEEYFVPEAELTGAEQRAATRTIERAVRGLVREQISRDDFYAALPAIYSFDDRFTQNELDAMSDEEYDALVAEEPEPTKEEIRKSLAKLKSLADRANVPDEPYHADFALEMTKVVDRLLPAKAGR